METQQIRLLAIEDTEDDFVVIRDMLDLIPGYEFQLDWVKHYEDAIAAIQSCVSDSLNCNYDACLLDYQLGSMNGMALLQNVLEQDVQLPIIFLTGMESRDIDIQAMEIGAAAFLSKHEITPSLLERTIRYVIRQQQSRVVLHQACQDLALEKTVLEDKVTEQSHQLSQTQSELESTQARAQYLHQLQTQLLSSVAHEFRTPLSTIQGAAYLLAKQSQANEEQRLQRLQKIEAGVKRITQTLDNSLLYAALEAGEVQYHPDVVPLATFCQNLVTDIQRLAAQDQEIQLFMPQEPLPQFQTDAYLLQVVLTHLLFNAIRYSPHKTPINLELAVEKSHAETTAILFRISDQGIGIPVADQSQIFDAYYRASNAGSISGTPGVGLGLAVVKQIVDLLGGSISLTSDVKTGTTFTVKLAC